MDDELQERQGMTFIEHLEEFRWTVAHSLAHFRRSDLCCDFHR